MKPHYFRVLFLWTTLHSLVNSQLSKPAITVRCSEDNHCPKLWPCCSPYGECGSGPTCVGGCDPRYSFNQDSCIPLPVLVFPFNVAFHHNFVSNKFQINANQRYAVENSLMANTGNGDGEDGADEDYYRRLAVAMHEKGFIHHSKYLITKNDQEAKDMISKYNFIYSGYTTIDYNTGEILVTMPKRTTGSMIASSQEFLYGRASVTMKTARSQGVVTAVVLISQVGDEVDFEFLGSQRLDAQTNYYFQTELDYTKMQRQPIGSDSYENYHTYGFDWDEERIIWLIDGRPMRTLFKRDTWDPVRGVFKYPQTPARLEVAIWPGGDDDNDPGTIEWAGGRIDWDNALDIIQHGQFYARVREIHIEPEQNGYFGEIYDCLRAKTNKKYVDITDLLKTTCSYSQEAMPKFSENSLIWHCDYTPRVRSWRDSGFTTQSKLRRIFPFHNPFKFHMSNSSHANFTVPMEDANSRDDVSAFHLKKNILDLTKVRLQLQSNESNTTLYKRAVSGASELRTNVFWDRLYQHLYTFICAGFLCIIL